MLQDLVKHHLSSVIITGAVAAVSAYVLWGGDAKTWKNGRLRPSLENLGNTCFLNCVTQALASVDSFYAWIQEILLAQRQQDNTSDIISDDVRKTAPMISALYDVFTTLQKSTDGSQSTSLNKVHKAMSEHGWETLFSQEDAYEAFQILVTSIERESKMLLSSESHKLFTSPAQGKFIISLECLECRTESSKQIEAFDNITLHLSQKQNVSLLNLSFNSLRDLLTTYFSTEKLTGVECDHCTARRGVPVKCDFIKHVRIAKAPKCLCIQINRTDWEHGVMTKNNQHVSFPVGSLDLTLFAYRALLFSREEELIEQEPAVSRPVEGYEVVRTYDIKERSPLMMEGLNYTLKSVIVHYGTANSGHYVTYRRLDDARWLYASDDVVRLATRDELERQQIYLLYYERTTIDQNLEQAPSTPPPQFAEGEMTPPVMVSDPNRQFGEGKMTPPGMLSEPNSPPVMSSSSGHHDGVMTPPFVISGPSSPPVLVSPVTFEEQIDGLSLL